jgi:hypothetical protein
MKRIFSLVLISFLLCLSAKAWAVPAAPVMSYSTNGLNLSITWSQVPDATSYTLYYAPYPYLGPETVGSVDIGNQTRVSVTLWEGAAFIFAITAYNPSGEGGISNIEHFVMTLSAPDAPVFSVVTDGLNLSLSWTEVPDATGYKLYYAYDTNPESFHGIDVGDVTNGSFYLWEGAAYYLKVTSYGASGLESEPSNTEYFVMGPPTPEWVDDDGDGFIEVDGDCDDSDALINPDAEEVCGDDIDQDCNGTDEICPIDPNNTYRWVCKEGTLAVALLLDPALEEGIRARLNRFEEDLCAAGYSVVERLSNLDTPPEIRTYLTNLHTATGGSLAGTIMIGDLPYAYQFLTTTYANPNIPPTSQELISFQYYTDLDGVFESSSGYVSPGENEYSYDLHSGNTDWEIWVGVLPMYKGDYAQTIEALNSYFDRNHAYRAGQYAVPRVFMQITELHSAATSEEHDQQLAILMTGQYPWTPFSNTPDALFYFNSSATGLTVAQGYVAMSAGRADFVVADAHGYWGGHGQIDVAWVEANPVNTTFFWSNGCAVGNLDYADNFLAAMLYSPTSTVLVARGSTNNSGGMGTNENGFFGHNIATAMSQGQSMGQAVLSHVNVPLRWPWSDHRELHFAPNVILGDPTLGLRP